MRIHAKDANKYVGKEVELCGWIDVRRDHGKLIFFDLRDRTGKVQLVITPADKKLHALAERLRPEWVVKVKGGIAKRPEEMVNPKEKTGGVEVKVSEIEILAEAKTPPFDVSSDGYEIDEELRMKYRYLDLKRPRLRQNLILRDEVIAFIRDWLRKKDFIEIETPVLTKSTPEGARDYIVPSRLHPGEFYALPQSPQQYKQLLMVAGLERYFQIARCFRDEDTRGDRQPEFTQLDLEMSFADREEILELIENLFSELAEKVAGKKIFKKPFPRFSHEEAVKKFQDDKFDLRQNKDSEIMAFAWVLDFPLFKKTATQEISPSHHPFTAPQEPDIALLDTDPMKVSSWQYDLVLNGYEIGGGSIRITDPDLQMKVFNILGYSAGEVREKFGHLLEAYAYGGPPHGGIALGLDRLLAVLAGEPNIREVIAFPKTGDGRDLMMNAPSEVKKGQLAELGISIKKANRKSK